MGYPLIIISNFGLKFNICTFYKILRLLGLFIRSYNIKYFYGFYSKNFSYYGSKLYICTFHDILRLFDFFNMKIRIPYKNLYRGL